MHAHFSFERTLQVLACTYLGFATHSTCTHSCKHKKHINTHVHINAHGSSMAALSSVFAGEISPALSSVPRSYIMLAFHKITKAGFAGF